MLNKTDPFCALKALPVQLGDSVNQRITQIMVKEHFDNVYIVLRECRGDLTWSGRAGRDL